MRELAVLTALLALAIPAIVPQLADLPDDELAELLAQEQAGSARKGLIEAIELEQLHRVSAAEDAAAAAKKNADEEEGRAAAAKEAPAAVTDWQHPDYAGPLHGGQAAWRNANLKSDG